MQLDTLEKTPHATQIHSGGVMQRTWHLSSLSALERFLHQAVLSLIKASTANELFVWMPQLWLHLTGHSRELIFQQALRNSGTHIYTIVGGRGSLSRSLMQRLPTDIYSCTCDISPFEDQRTFQFYVMSDYLLLAQFDKNTAGAVDSFFEKARDRENIAPAAMRELLQAKAAITLTLVRDPLESAKLRSKFERFLRA